MNRCINGKYHVLILLAMIAVAALRCSMGSEVQNERVVVFMPDGVTPAADVQVRVVPVDYLPGEDVREIYTTMTNREGWCLLEDILPGAYNIVASKDSLVCLQKAVMINERSYLWDDTLETAGLLEFVVKMQPHHDPQCVNAQLVGTPYFQHPDPNGNCSFSLLPVGSYLLRVNPQHEMYNTGLRSVAVQPVDTFPSEVFQDSDTAKKLDSSLLNSPDPVSLIIKMEIELPYLGIPVPDVHSAVFDPVSEVVTVSWNSTSTWFDAFNDYVIFRDISDMSEQSGLVVGSTVLRTFTDTLADLRTDTERILELSYRVAVRDSASTIGETFGFAAVTVKLSPLPEPVE